MWEIGLWDFSQPTFLPGFLLIIPKLNCWSFRQLIRRYDSPNNVCQRTTDHAEICPHCLNWSGAKTGLSMHSVCAALNCCDSKLNICGFECFGSIKQATYICRVEVWEIMMDICWQFCWWIIQYKYILPQNQWPLCYTAWNVEPLFHLTVSYKRNKNRIKGIVVRPLCGDSYRAKSTSGV